MGNLHGKGSHYTSGYTCGTTYIRKHPSLLIFEVQHRVVTISLSLFFSISPSELRTMKNVLFTKASKWQRGCFFFSNFVQCVQFKCGLSEKMVSLSAKKKKNSCWLFHLHKVLHCATDTQYTLNMCLHFPKTSWAVWKKKQILFCCGACVCSAKGSSLLHPLTLETVVITLCKETDVTYLLTVLWKYGYSVYVMKNIYKD